MITIIGRAVEDKVRITVRDNGKGIARREHKNIFQKFYRVDDLLTRKENGSGLGLAIVQHVVKGHRGKVEVDSAPGMGSAFSIVLSTERTKVAPLLPDGSAVMVPPGKGALEERREAK